MRAADLLRSNVFALQDTLSNAITRIDGAEEEERSELRSRFDTAGERLRDGSDPTETREMIATLQEQHTVKADALRETMESALRTDLDTSTRAERRWRSTLPICCGVVPRPSRQRCVCRTAVNNNTKTRFCSHDVLPAAAALVRARDGVVVFRRAAPQSKDHDCSDPATFFHYHLVVVRRRRRQ